ncbi:hypothetical protein ACLOJK_005336 [Asimina triloba]
MGSDPKDGSFVGDLCYKLDSNVAEIEGDAPLAKRLRRASSDALQDVVSGEELSLYTSAPNNSESAQKTFSFAVRDSLINIGPLKDFAHGLRTNADPNATGVAKQSNYELVCCSGHGKNGALCILQQSVRPDLITEVELAGCKGIWTVYHKSARGHSADPSKTVSEDDEYHAYLIISLESRTMLLLLVSGTVEFLRTSVPGGEGVASLVSFLLVDDIALASRVS